MDILSISDVYDLGKKVAKDLFVGEHNDVLTRAKNKYEAINLEEEGYKEELNKVLELLEQIPESAKLYVQAKAYYLRALCLIGLKRHKQARKSLLNVLQIITDHTTLNKEQILKAQEASRELLAESVSHDYLEKLKPYDKEDEDICRRFSFLLVNFISYSDNFTGEVLSFKQIGTGACFVPFLLKDVETEFNVVLNDEPLLGVRRDELEAATKQKYKDVDIIKLIRNIKSVLYPAQKNSSLSPELMAKIQNQTSAAIDTAIDFYNEWIEEEATPARLDTFLDRLENNEAIQYNPNYRYFLEALFRYNAMSEPGINDLEQYIRAEVAINEALVYEEEDPELYLLKGLIAFEAVYYEDKKDQGIRFTEKNKKTFFECKEYLKQLDDYEGLVFQGREFYKEEYAFCNLYFVNPAKFWKKINEE